MAVVLGETYPDIFAAVGAHSGLAFASAHDIPSAMAAMKAGRGRNGAANSAQAAQRRSKNAVPTIVFHGDRDHTVQHSNGAAILQQASDAYAASGKTDSAALATRTEGGAAAGGRTYSRSVHVESEGRSQLEFWTLHGAGHAWSGGSPSGSYTDGKGPDASAEMVRFFLAQPRAGAA
jgi:poly(3-hydroxybutyrate) depolymerase